MPGPVTQALSHHLSWSSIHTHEAQMKFSFCKGRNWSSNQLSSLFRFTPQMSSKPGFQPPDLHSSILQSVVLDSGMEFETCKVPSVHRSQRLGGKIPTGAMKWISFPAPLSTEVSCSVRAPLWTQWHPALYSFYSFVNKIHAYPQPASRVVQLKYIMSVKVFEHIKDVTV